MYSILRLLPLLAWPGLLHAEVDVPVEDQAWYYEIGGAEPVSIALNPAGARVGDRILLSFETGSLLKATFLIYVFPIIFLIAGAALGQALASFIEFSPSTLSVLLGFTFFFTALLFMKARANKMAKKNAYQPKIIKILT